jgi:hypothetical protein
MKSYLIILLVYFNLTVSQLSNNESLLVFNTFYNNRIKRGLFTARFGKTLKQINESDLDFLANDNSTIIREIDYSLSANVIIWREIQYNNSDQWFDVFYAIPINKR